jgi:hypothetical protein
MRSKGTGTGRYIFTHKQCEINANLTERLFPKSLPEKNPTIGSIGFASSMHEIVWIFFRKYIVNISITCSVMDVSFTC